MIPEYIGDNKKVDPKKYETKVGCANCDYVYLIQVEKGLEVDKFIKDTKYKCERCECIETLQSWRQYLAGRAMLRQLMDFSQKDEDIESKKLDHYG